MSRASMAAAAASAAACPDLRHRDVRRRRVTSRLRDRLGRARARHRLGALRARRRRASRRATWCCSARRTTRAPGSAPSFGRCAASGRRTPPRRPTAGTRAGSRCTCAGCRSRRSSASAPRRSGALGDSEGTLSTLLAGVGVVWARPDAVSPLPGAADRGRDVRSRSAPPSASGCPGERGARVNGGEWTVVRASVAASTCRTGDPARPTSTRPTPGSPARSTPGARIICVVPR